MQELVKLHGGEIDGRRATSAAARTFTVSIPFGHAHLPAEHIVGGASGGPAARRRRVRRGGAALAAGRSADDEPSDAGDGGQSDTGSHDDGRAEVARILLADDNADMREYAQRLLAERWARRDGRQRTGGARGGARAPRRT